MNQVTTTRSSGLRPVDHPLGFRVTVWPSCSSWWTSRRVRCSVERRRCAQSGPRLKEELRCAQRAALRTTAQNSYLQDKRRVGRDLVIGAAIGGALIPLTGLEPAALAYGGVMGRSALSLVWSWLKKSNSAYEEDGLARCFAAFLDPPDGE